MLAWVRTKKGKTYLVQVYSVKNPVEFGPHLLATASEGRGGVRKRRQYSLPVLFDIAQDAAVYLAVMKRDMKAAFDGTLIVPPKQNKEHKPRQQKPAQPAVTAQPPPQPEPQLQSPLATVVGMPMPMLMPQLPIATASPVPMQPLCYFPPRF